MYEKELKKESERRNERNIKFEEGNHEENRNENNKEPHRETDFNRKENEMEYIPKNDTIFSPEKNRDHHEENRTKKRYYRDTNRNDNSESSKTNNFEEQVEQIDCTKGNHLELDDGKGAKKLYVLLCIKIVILF